MSGRVFDGRIARGIAPDDRARQERLKATARALVTAVRDGLVRDGVVRLHGFGTFRLRPVAARRGRHPRTGEPIDIPAGWRVMFRPAKALRERVEPDRAPALPIGEPHASREAMLAASPVGAEQTIQPGAGRVPAGGPAVPPLDDSGRAAAAAIPEAKRSVHGSIPPGPANPPEPSDLEADSRVTRSPDALTRAPAANEPPAVEPSTEGPENPPRPAADAPAAGRGRGVALLVLLVVLLAGLAWLLRPVDSPAPPVAEESATSGSDQVPADAAGTPPDSVTDAGASRERESAADATESAAKRADADNQVTRTDDAPAVTSSAAADERSESAAAAGDSATVAAPDTGTVGGDAIVRTKERNSATTSQGAADAGVPAPSADEAARTDDDALAALSGSAGAATPAPAPAPAESSSDETAPAATGDAADAGGETTPAVEEVTATTGTPATAGDAVGTTTADGSPYFAGRDYTVRRGDTLWDLADRHYVNPYYWPHIWNHNGGIANPNRLDVRQGLWLPALEGDPRTLTEADRRSIAEGYLRLYRFFREQGDANPQYALVGVRYFDASVLPQRLRGTAAGRPGDTLAAAFQARLEAEFPLD